MGKVTLTIDGRELQVEQGTTLLDAARTLGIEIPTLCAVDGIEPASSCYLCVVQVEGHPRLSPSCATLATDGMVVESDSDDVLATRKMALELLLSDHAGDCSAPCTVQCPAELEIPEFIREAVQGRFAESMEIVSRTLVLPGALGRVCPRLCENSCHRARQDASLAIGALHRHVADQDREAEEPYRPPCAEPSGKSVAIVGAGPAGLAAAYYLARRGHACTLFDAHPEAGGMLRYGIPSFRLPREELAAEVAAVERLGARFQLGRRWGEDFTLAELRADHDAVFLAIGAQRTRGLGCEGEELALSGIEFLHGAATGRPATIGEQVLVIGGGNTAMDVARSAVRVAHGEVGAAQVRVLYRRTRQEMPCLLEEVEAAEEEGVSIDYLVLPVHIERLREGRLRVTCRRMELGEPDASGRRRPVPIDGSDFDLEATSVLACIGQQVDTSLAEREGLPTSGWGIETDPVTLATGLEGVFAGGDAVLGPDLVVRAVAQGRRVSVSIDQWLRGRPVSGPPTEANVTFEPQSEEELAVMLRDVERAERTRAPSIDMQQRLTTFEDVHPPMTPAEVVREGMRCMSCSCRKIDSCRLRRCASAYNADPLRFGGSRRHFERELTHPDLVYEPGKCIACDACVRVAAEHAEPLGVTIIGRGFEVAMAVPFDAPLAEGLVKSAQACAEVCPTGAISLRTMRACDLGCSTMASGGLHSCKEVEP